MLIRSSSAPIANSWLPTKESLPETELVPRRARRRSITLTCSLPPVSISYSDESKKKTTVALSSSSMETTCTSCNLDDLKMANDEGFPVNVQKKVYGTLLAGGGGGGKITGGGGGVGRSSEDEDGDGNAEFSDSNCGKGGNMEGYYQNMIEANLGNALLLGNYARFLKEVKGDVEKAEEYCGRAILANPNDASILSLYADIIWEAHKDSSRAESYFEQAVQAAPDDCFVMASYAHFLWDAEEDEEECDMMDYNGTLQPNFVHGTPLTVGA